MSARPAAPGLRVALLSGAPVWRGSSAVYAQVAAGLAGRGHEALVVVDDAAVAERMTREGARAQYVPLRDTGLGEFSRLRTALVPLRPQVLIADRPRDLRLAAIATLGWPTRLVYRYNLAHRAFPGDPLSRLALLRAAGVVFPSKAIARLAFGRTPRLRQKAWALIPNGVDTETFRPDPVAGAAWRRAQEIPAEALVVLLPAAMERGKGHEPALAAVASLLPTLDRRVIFVAAGAGRLAAVVAARTEALGVEARFPGALPTDELRAAFAAADVVVHPSDMETFGMSVAEAMACGRPVVATAVGGVPEITGQGGGAALLVPAGDVAALGEALGGLLRDPARRAALGDAARHRIVSRYPLAAMLDGYERWCLRLADRG